MRFLKLYDWKTNDPVKTEETILSNLKKESISSNFLVADYHWADSINKNGIQYTQKKIDDHVFAAKGKKIIFICQHISAKNLNWHNSLVFSPHATINDNFIPIPHYSCFYSENSLKKDLDASFVGAFETHNCRKKISQLYKNYENWYIQDTGAWHFYNSFGRKEREKHYKDIMSRSKIILCPRGTGPGSIRLWECLSSNCLPIVISDTIQLPDELLNLIPVISLESVVILDRIVNKCLEKDYNERIKKIKKIHDEKFSNNNLHAKVIDRVRNNE